MHILGTAIDPVAFKLGPITVAWYGIIIATAMVTAVTLSNREAKRIGIEEDFVIDLSIWMLPLAIVGARIYYVLFNIQYYMQHPTHIFYIWEGGIAIYGGLIAGCLVLLWYTNKKNIDTWIVLDVLVPYIFLAQSIGRWGNFVNQEAHGSEVSRSFLEALKLPMFIIEGMHINGSYYHPTFLYESIVTFLGCIALLFLRQKNRFLRRGETTCLYLIWYGIGRFFIEGMRTDSLYLGPLRISQVVSALSVFAGLLCIWYRRTRLYPPIAYYSEGIDSFNQTK